MGRLLLRIIDGPTVAELLSGAELILVERVSNAYLSYETGKSLAPPSAFLRPWPNQSKRFIALPAYLNGEDAIAGIKWIGSFPDNVATGRPRASAVVILNSLETGYPIAIIEGSLISAKRTAASAALAAKRMHGDEITHGLGVVGCGVINLEIYNFLRALFAIIPEMTLFDLEKERAIQFAAKIKTLSPQTPVHIASSLDDVLRRSDLVSFATTAVKPHLLQLPSGIPPLLTFLHVSLRDLSPEIVVQGENFVDDIDYACSHHTSLALCEAEQGNREFIKGTIGSLISGVITPRQRTGLRIFSPFGLGVLDLAIANYLLRRCEKEGRGLVLPSFFPQPH